ncbi:hypothetical protein A3F00_05115 [Candidatus Daviesbacteria bacterium RIFCSPHIGHO2_12_FULL_37_11]|uniref:UDP-N-acetylmuramate--L-alanine ligase n=1 Tax=Candidatus Daviesbacteria bacterium RIFCSPHIGHO2_12_FULL_37_11 TaxID=1797777 RepID=A0A1F5K9G6_9BACT|nr:MAG: hypothetical protein A3F00_05115 [Candidatus Daviesbacteria bacterium RIFCSPHIGHO2_12_FULL_37_11]
MRVHFMGIAGSGASAAAAIAKAYGFGVSGCDLSLEGHNPKHLGCDSRSCRVDVLAVTPAVFSFDPGNDEVETAKKSGIEVITWQEFVGKYLLKDKFVIAVTGTHGKSTTTAMVAKVLEDAGLDPTVLLGAILPEWGTNFRIPVRHPELVSGSQEIPNPDRVEARPKGRQVRNDDGGDDKGIFVIEADEAYDNFLNYKPDIAIVTNIEMDHPEYFKDLSAIMDSFEKFLLGTRKTIIGNVSDPNVAEILKDVMKSSSVNAIDYTKHELNISLKIPGEFNILNAKAAFQVGLLLGIDPTIIRNSLSNFTGVSRRFEYLGTYKGRKVYSDFGHHPTEVKTTMQAAREKFPNQYIWLIFQPHMFSRTKALFKEFVSVFKNIPANQALILDIYPSREADTSLVKSQELVDAVDSNKVDYLSGVEELKVVLDKEVRPGDIIFFMGAGDIDQMARNLIK